MRKFSRPIDLRSRREMTDYLRNHFRYSTMNSWNHATSYACNLKIYGLGLDPEIESKLYDMLDTREFLLMRQEALYLFNAVHNFRWQAGFNGRSGGYLILYQGDLMPQCCRHRQCLWCLRESSPCRFPCSTETARHIPRSGYGHG